MSRYAGIHHDWLGKAMVACLVLCGVSAAAFAAEGVSSIQRAQFVVSSAAMPPGDDAAWTDVTLPHDWRTLEAHARLTGWYRVKLALDAIPAAPQGVYLRNLRAFVLDLYVNGRRHVGSRELFGRGAQDYGFALHALVPAALWKNGENILYFRVVGSSYPRRLHGLGRIHVGPFADTRQLAARDYELGGGALRLSFAAALTAGLITLFLWMANRNDRVMFWFSVSCLSWALAAIPNFWLRPYTAQWILDILNAYVRAGMPAPVFIMILRTVEQRWPRVELGLALLLLLHCTMFLYAPLLGPALDGHWAMRLAWPTFAALLLLAGVAVVARFAPRPLAWSHYMEMAALAVMGTLLLQDPARYSDWADLDSIIVRHYHVPVMVLAIGLVIFERHVAALWRGEIARSELELRVAEAVSEIESNQHRIASAMREQSLVRERQRILADMHDGLGASLVGLLRYVQVRPADTRGIEQRVREALQEMRIAIDALDPDQSDLSTLLGNLRYRLAPLMEAGGVHLAWEVAEMPGFKALDPHAVFSIQRAVLEALFNALKHSGAKQIRLTAQPVLAGIEIRIEDDGLGFDVGQPGTGRGLGTMRERIRAIGGSCEIRSRPGSGTAVIFRFSNVVPMRSAEPAMPDPERPGASLIRPVS